MKILLTGTSGQVGNALRETLRDLGELVVADRSQMDLSNPDQIRSFIRSVQPSLIINPAAYTAVDKAESETAMAQRINGEAPGIIAEEAAKLGAALIHYSTDYVFDGSKRGADGKLAAYSEQDMPQPVNVYGKTKLAGEQAIAASGCAHLIFRTSWVYSRFGQNFLLTMLRLANERDALKIVNDQWGAPTWAGWIAQATADVVRRLQRGSRTAQELDLDTWKQHSGIYNMSTLGCTNWCEFARAIIGHADTLGLLHKAAPSITGIPSSEYPVAATRPHNSMLSMDLLTSRFQVQPPQWEQAMKACLESAGTAA
ncbi:dTDP-4-dehydrorhamnose reductase [Undibacterium sp.]|uniref:dTDP-4-dehydrorhamnose reductase n=1 Tax=Undibacterium sp. TaxID=1914977 RepID=UPI00374DCF5C